VHQQVTRELGALCIQARQQKAPPRLRSIALNALGAWLHFMHGMIEASSESRLAASVRQQLQGSGLLQHMGAMFLDATDGLTSVAAAAATAAATAYGVEASTVRSTNTATSSSTANRTTGTATAGSNSVSDTASGRQSSTITTMPHVNNSNSSGTSSVSADRLAVVEAGRCLDILWGPFFAGLIQQGLCATVFQLVR
jgi:hypothetical protein